MGLESTGEKGLLAVVANPANDDLYLFATNGPTAADKSRVYRATLDQANAITIDATPIVAADTRGPGLEGPQNLLGGGLVIHGGHLYVGVGDGGFNSQPPTNKFASCLNRPNGKILRVNLDGSIPSDNPLASTAMVTACGTATGAWTEAAPDRRIFAWGLLGFATVYLNAARRAFDITVERMPTRTSIALTRSMAHHPEVQHNVAEMRIALDAATALLERTATDWADGANYEDWPVRLVACRAFVINQAFKVVDIALDLSGGAGASSLRPVACSAPEMAM